MDVAYDRILVVGDTHAHTSWLRDVVLPSAAELEVEAIVVLGDFGYWPDANDFLRLARGAQRSHGVAVAFLDGNHEHHHYLRDDVATFGIDLSTERIPVWLGGGLTYLPRGARFSLGSLEVLCLGGAASIDRQGRIPGEDWFSEELLSPADLEFSAARPADLLLCHDAPSGWSIPNLPPLHTMDRDWLDELAHCQAQRSLLRQVLDAVEAQAVFHGHYHSAYELRRDEKWGRLRVVGLGRDGRAGWGAVLSTVGDELVIEREHPLLLDKRPWPVRHALAST